MINSLQKDLLVGDIYYKRSTLPERYVIFEKHGYWSFFETPEDRHKHDKRTYIISKANQGAFKVHCPYQGYLHKNMGYKWQKLDALIGKYYEN